jgi:hypothetical protein
MAAADDGASAAASASTSATEGAAAGAESGLGRLSELAWQALPAIGSAIGFAGFVAVIGAAIELIRFHAAHLPAVQAVQAVPRPELIIVGAIALAGSVAGGVLAVLVVYLADNEGGATVRTVRGLVAVAVAEMLVTLIYIPKTDWWIYVLLVGWLLAIGLIAVVVVGEVIRNFRNRDALKLAHVAVLEARERLGATTAALAAAIETAAEVKEASTLKAREQARIAMPLAEHEWRRTLREWEAAADDIASDLPVPEARRLARVRRKIARYDTEPPTIDALEASLDLAENDTAHVFRAVGVRLLSIARELGHGLAGSTRGAGFLLILLGPGSFVVGVVLVASNGTFSWLVLVLVIVMILAVANLLVARATEKFAWYGVAVFFSVLLFGATLTIAKTLDKPLARPTALVRKGDYQGICGVFIAQTADRVYIGRMARGGSRSRPGLIFWIPTADVDLVSVGQFQPIGPDFSRTAVSMLAQLYRDRAEQPSPALKNTTIVEDGNNAKQVHTTTTAEAPAPSVAHERYPSESPAGDCASTPESASAQARPATIGSPVLKPLPNPPTK